MICNITDSCKEVICLIEDLNLNHIIVIDDSKDGHDIYCGTQKTVNTQGAKKVIFTACHSGKLKLAFTSPNVISTRPKIFSMSRMNDFPVIGDPCFAHRILGSPGGKHCESLQRNVWRGVVSLLRAVSLDRKCRILP